MTHKILCVIIAVLSITSALAAVDDKEKMNSIKVDSTYYWGEATADNKVMATADATYTLIETIFTDGITVTEDQLKGKIEFLYIPRGERTRAFAYIQKGLLNNLPPVPVTPNPSEPTEQTATETVTQPIPQQVQQSEPALTPQPVSTPASVSSSVLMLLSQCQQVTDAYRCIKEYSQNGSIDSYGKVTSQSQLAESNYLIIFDKNMSVKAILAPSDGSGRKNIITGATDNISNYRGCGAIWFK